MSILKCSVLLLALMSSLNVMAEELEDSICMPKIFGNEKLIDYMGKMKGLNALSSNATSKNYYEQINKIYSSAKPSFKHCKQGQWIPTLGSSYALEYCDFSKTPASAAALGACRYRGKERKIIRN